MKKYNSRKEVPDKYKWNLTDFFKTEKDFQENLKKCKSLVNDLKKYIGCTKDAHKLYEFLNKEIEAIALWEDLYVYAYLINDQELGNEKSIKRKNQTEQLNLELEMNLSFFAPELLKLSKDEYDNLYKEEEKLLEFKVSLDRIYREKEHTLTENEEQIISSLINSMNHYDDISSTILNSLHDYGTIKVKGEEVTIATNNYRHLMKNKDKNIRKDVREKFNKTIDQYSTVNAMLLSSYVSMNDTIAKIRHFDSAWDQKLFELNLDNNVFKTLVDTTEDNINVLQKYYKLKKEVLNLEELTSDDMALDMAKLDKEYTIEEAQEIVLEAVKPLGEEYQSKFKKIFDNNYIDYCQYKGKCSGGYSSSTINKNSRILMSYNGNLESISTIAHEGGHNVNHQYVMENNPKQYRNIPRIADEVASLTNECLLSSYFAKNGKTKEERLAGIANILDVIVSNLFGAVREGKMEEDMYNEVHNGGVLTKEFLDKLSYNSLSKYYGNSVKYDDKIKNGWVNRSHYYMNFYLYSYAISISVASYVADKILSGDKKILDKYIEFLKVGSDSWPIDTFKILGIDLCDKTVYKNAINYFDKLIDKYYEINNGGE